MKIRLLSAFLGCAAFCLLSAADLSQIQAVYLLPMGNSMDQYLANHLANKQVFQIVTDPKSADSVMTDRIGAALEDRLAELYPPEPQEKSEDGNTDQTLQGDVFKVPPSSFSRSKGNLFLVDLKTRQVIWSTYEPAKDSSPKQLNKTAEKVAQQLSRLLKGK
jgi:hypothetical protein